MRPDLATNTSLWGSFGMALLGTTCCALPIALVALGMGSAIASLIAVMPWLTVLSRYKGITFTLTAVVIVYSWYRLKKQEGRCDIEDAKRLKRQWRFLGISSIVLVISVFTAYLLLPLTLMLEDG